MTVMFTSEAVDGADTQWHCQAERVAVAYAVKELQQVCDAQITLKTSISEEFPYKQNNNNKTMRG